MPPDNLIDTSLFCQKLYPLILRRGLRICPLKIIHNARLHYQPRFRCSETLQFINALIETFTSFDSKLDWHHLYLSDTESAELQGRSTEVIATGICIGLASTLFSINKNQINVIERSGKRCDFRFEKNGLEYILESKGRKGNIKSAILDVLAKKAADLGAQPKYGIISRLPRGEGRSSIVVVDPEYQPTRVSRESRAAYLLSHYSTKARFAGFWRLAELLDQRKSLLQRGASLAELDGNPLEFGNVIKMGMSIDFNVGRRTHRAFFQGNAQDTSVFRKKLPPLFGALDENVIRLLETQNYDGLFNFSGPDITLRHAEYVGSLNNDGSVLLLRNKPR